ncbi:Uncharacterised protein [uncultured Clostridium sp.]|uniref:hypothetical protein n=1 Tax=uncultured Clostridium sp. TaxID=59620 RepID=UPI0008234164|nr:hypothetical protein [uncultured Clostridium sp.]SCJ09904.1 Uncharacterised protein [uncultured Clostridium sp.]
MEKIYLRIETNEEGEIGFGFILPEAQTVLESDIEISLSDYNKFHELNSKGKQFRLKEISTGNSLFDYIEGYDVECIPCDPTKEEMLEEEVLLQSEYLLDMEFRMTNLELGL